MAKYTKKFGDWWGKFRIVLGFWIFLLGFGGSVVAGLGVLGIQIFFWAKTGKWSGMELADAFRASGVDLSSVYNPTDWIGLASTAKWFLELPLSLCLPVLGFAVFKILQGMIDGTFD